MIKLTKNITEANCITHGSVFHADEVFATAIIGKIKDVILMRVNDNLPNIDNKDILIYDIGGGKFDHHQNNSPVRKDGVSYASCGLIWQAFGKQVLKEFYKCDDSILEDAYKILNRDLIEYIDASDNGEVPKLDVPYKMVELANIISGFNPRWDEVASEEERFLEASNIANLILDNVVKETISKLKARTIVEEKITHAKKGIMILDKFLPWKEALLLSPNKKAQTIFFVIYPSKRGGYNVIGVPKELNSFINRKDFPSSWRGLKDKDFQNKTGVKSALFCHKAGFICAAKNLDDAIRLANMAMKEETCN